LEPAGKVHKLSPHSEHLPIGISYVIDESVLQDKVLEFSKCIYVAIGLCNEIRGGKAPEILKGILAGTIGKFFGTGNQ
jgi:hypothetical protein